MKSTILDLRHLPEELLRVDGRFLSESRVQAILTTLEGSPICSYPEIAEDRTGTNMGYLMMAVPLDSNSCWLHSRASPPVACW